MLTRRSTHTAGPASIAAQEAHGAPVTPAYQPQPRTFVISMVPVLSKEFAAFLPYLKEDFAAGGELSGKQVYAFLPAVVSAYAGDTITFEIYNPADHAHTMTFISLQKTVDVPGPGKATLTLPALAPGIYDFACLEPEHEPFMTGQLTILAPPA